MNIQGTETVIAVQNLLMELHKAGFYGEVVIKLEDGEVVRVTKQESIIPRQLQEQYYRSKKVILVRKNKDTEINALNEEAPEVK